MLSGFFADRYFWESLTLSSSCFSFGTSNNTFKSKSASFLYLFVSIEPINDTFKTGYFFSNSLICSSISFLTLGLIFGFLVSASSNTAGANVLLGISIILSFIKSLNLISFLTLILFVSNLMQYHFLV